jgi:hypothetical protein
VPTDDDVVLLFRKLEEVLDHDNAVTLMELLHWSAAAALDRQVPGWRLRGRDRRREP